MAIFEPERNNNFARSSQSHSSGVRLSDASLEAVRSSAESLIQEPEHRTALRNARLLNFDSQSARLGFNCLQDVNDAKRAIVAIESAFERRFSRKFRISIEISEAVGGQG